MCDFLVNLDDSFVVVVGSSHIEGGLNMGLVLQALRKTKTLTYQLVLPIQKRFFPTTRAHYHKFS
jgi:predicted ATPase